MNAQIPPLSHEFEALVAQLFRRYPSGLRGSHQELVSSLIESGLDQADAELAVRSLEEARRAHYLGGNWVFTRHPVELPRLLRTLEQEYPEFVGHDPWQAKAHATEYIASKLGLDMDVAREVMEDLEAAGYTGLGHDPELERTRLLIFRP